MAPSTRFERVTYRLGGDCSIRLSYEGAGFKTSVIFGEILERLKRDRLHQISGQNDTSRYVLMHVTMGTSANWDRVK